MKNIVIISDSNYMMQASVMLQSLFENNRQYRFHIFLLTTGIDKEDEEKVRNQCHAFDSQLTILSLDDDMNQFAALGRWSKMVFAKLFIGHLLPKDIDEAIYLDVDMIVHRDLSELLNLKLDERYALAAVRDTPWEEKNLKLVRLSKDDVFINSGVMCLNLPLWREAWEKGAFKKEFDYCVNELKLEISDQEVINRVFAGKIQIIPYKFNVISLFFFTKWKHFQKDFLPTWKETRKKMVVVHFTHNKPWNWHSTHYMRHAWFNYLSRSPYAMKESELTPKLSFRIEREIRLAIEFVVDHWRML